MRRFTASELVDRVRQALLARVESITFAPKPRLLEDDDLFVDEACRTSLFSHVSEFLLPGCETGRGDRHGPAELCQISELRRSADSALEGRFSLLGFEGLAFGNPIDWHLEPISGRRSPMVPWKQLDSLDPSLTGDKKIVWELNRHQHLFALGRLYRYTGEDRYAEAIASHIDSWIRANPIALGINWVSSLELAFRSVSWLWAIAFLRSWSKWPALPLRDIAQTLHWHGCHIEKFLSTYSSPNTHLTGEALGLFYLGTCLPELKRAERWRKLGRQILLRELERQIRADGVYFEQSTWYQRYTADFYMHFLLLSERSGRPLPSRVIDRTTALLDFLMWIMRPDGTSPYIGDDDGGKLVNLESSEPNDWRAVLSNGAVMFERHDYKYVAGNCREETAWIFGSAAQDRFGCLPGRPPATNSRAFIDGGFNVMRSGWAGDANYLLVDCGPHGMMNCGHAHADALAIEVAARGSTILVDPGTFAYTGSAELRDLFRSTAMHNTLSVDDQSSSIPAGPFKWRHIANSALQCWHDHELFTYFKGSHDGYMRLRDPVRHARQLFFVNREYWLMLDEVNAMQEHVCAAHFHLAPGTRATVHREAGRLEAEIDSTVLDIVYPDGVGQWELAEDMVSPCYGAKIAAPCAKYSMRTVGSVSLLSVLFPRSVDQMPAVVQSLHLERGESWLVASATFCDFFVRAADRADDAGIRGIDFEFGWLRRSGAGQLAERAVFLHGTRVSCHDFDLVADAFLEFAAISVQDRVMRVDVMPSVGMRIRPPRHIDKILVNGRVHTANGGQVIDVVGQGMPVCESNRDMTDRCEYVRY